MSRWLKEKHAEYFSRIFLYAHEYIERDKQANEEVVGECTIYCFNELYKARKSIKVYSTFLYDKAREFCTNYITETYGSDSFTDIDHFNLMVDVELIHALAKKGYTPENIREKLNFKK
jgi:hypothetical protein